MTAQFLLTAALFLGVITPGFSTLVMHERFDYAAGGVNGVATNALGLTGNWVTGTFGGGATPTTSFAGTSLTLAGHFVATGGSLEITTTSFPFYEAGASAAVSATLTGSSLLYTSSIMQFATANNDYYDDWVVEQRFNTSATGGFGTSSGRNMVRVYGSGSAPNGKGGVGVDNSEVVQGVGTNAPGTNYLLVTRYTISGANITQAELFTFDAASYALFLANADAGTADALLGTYATHTLTDTASRSLGDLAFLQYTINGGPIGRYDDFRLGTQVTDVVNVVPEPGTAVLALCGLVSLLRRRRS